MSVRARIPKELLARLSRLSPVVLAALGAVLLLLQLLVQSVERRNVWHSPLPDASVVARGFERRPDGTLQSSAAPDDFHSLEALIDFKKLRDYDVRFEVLDAPANLLLRVDFFAAPHYDAANQERAQRIDVESIGQRIRLRINSGWAPRQAYLRLFYVGPPGLKLGEIHFRPVPLLQSAFERSAGWLGLVLLISAAGLAIVRITHPSFAPNRVDPPGHSAWPLLACYLAAALTHMAVYLVTPLWRGDELQYKSLAAALWWLEPGTPILRHRSELSLDLPGRLYPFLISPALATGSEFYSVIRLINALWISSVVFPTFAIGRKVLPRAAALFVAALSAALPFTNLAAYAMTEVVFFPLYVTAAWLTLESLLQPRKLSWILALGCAAGVALSTRPTGIVVLPAFLICYGWMALRNGTVAELLRRPRWLLAPAVAVPTFLGLQWLTSVESVTSVGMYEIALDQRGFAHTLENPNQILDLMLGHLTTLSIPFALPLALLFCSGAQRSANDAATVGHLLPLRCVAVVFFLALFALALFFTILISGTDPGGLGRWHSRYYFHAYPLLMLAYAATLAAPDSSGTRRKPWAALVVALFVGAHLWFMEGRAASQSVWFGSIVDNMDVQWYAVWGALRWPLLAASLLLTRLWYRKDRWLRPASVGLVVLWIAVANLGTARKMQLGERLVPDPCGKLATSFLELRPGNFAIIGADSTFRESAEFWTPYLATFVGSIEAGSRYLAEPAAAQLDFIVTDQSAPLDPRFELQVDGGTCRIYARRS